MGHSVLCVDADRNLCQVMAKALEAEGYAVATEHDGERALAVVQEEAPDLVLLDLFLPGRDGFAVLEAVRELPGPARNTRVVLLSGCSTTPEYQRRAQVLDAVELLTKPVPLVRLTAVVAGQLGEAKPPMPTRPAEPRAAASGPGVAGDLARFSFAALLHHLHGSRATGVLHLQSGRKRKWLQLRDGYPTAVRSNLMAETLGSFLERTGRLSAAAAEESRRRLADDQLQGEMLVAMEALSEEELSEALREQAGAKLFEIFSWPQGTFHFEFGALLQRASGLERRSPANLILRGVRTRMPIERIDAWLDAQRHLHLLRGEEPFYRFQEIDLERKHRRLVEGLGEGRRLAELLEADEATRRTLFGLLRTGILDLRDVGAPRAASAPSGAACGGDAAPTAEPQRADLAAMAERFAAQTPFDVLGIDESADDAAVQAAYERRCGELHPDRISAGGAAVRKLAAEVFAHVERAYDTLRDSRRRSEYLLDRKRAEREAQAQAEGRRAFEAERHFQDGEMAISQRAYELALQSFGKSLELFPEEGEYHAHYGWALHLCHPDDATMAEEALEHCKRAIKLAGDREKPYLLMGRLCKATGRTVAAEKMFARAVAIQPNCVEALRELRLINMRRGNQKKGFIGRLLRR